MVEQTNMNSEEKKRERERAWKPIVPIATKILSIDSNPLEIKELMYNA